MDRIAAIVYVSLLSFLMGFVVERAGPGPEPRHQDWVANATFAAVSIAAWAALTFKAGCFTFIVVIGADFAAGMVARRPKKNRGKATSAFGTICGSRARLLVSAMVVRAIEVGVPGCA